jgi:hypothetical protein
MGRTVRRAGDGPRSLEFFFPAPGRADFFVYLRSYDMKLRNASLVRLLGLAALAAAAPLGCAGGGDGPAGGDVGSGADDLVAQVVFDRAVVKADAIEFPRALVPDAVLARIEAYQKNVAPKVVTRARRNVFGEELTEQAIDVDDLLAQERAFVARGGEKVILFGRPQGSVKPGAPIDEDVVTNPSGYLRRALSYELRGETVVVRTGPATMAEYFGELKVGQALVGAGPAEGLGVRRAPLTVPLDLNLLDVQNRQLLARSGSVDTPAGPVKGDASVSIQRAKVDLGGRLDVGIEIGQARVNEVHLKLDGTLTGSIDFAAVANGQFSTSTGQVKLLARPLKFALPPAGPVPLTLKVDLTANCNLDVNGKAQATVGGDVSADVSVGVEFRDGELTDIGQAPGFRASVRPPQLSLDATAGARCAVVPELEVLMFDAAGPSIGIEAFADAKFAAGAAFGASRGASASAQATLGANFVVGGEVQTPLFDFQLLDFGTTKVLGLESAPQTFATR